MRFLVLLAVMAMAAACAPKSTGHEGGPPPGFREGALPAPVPADVSVRITAADAGKTFTVPVGGSLAVQLVGVPTAGYVWAVAEKPSFLSEPKEFGGNTSTAQSQPGFTGGSHWEVFAFETLEAGQGELKLEQRRPWEPKSEPAAATFTVTFKAQCSRRIPDERRHPHRRDDRRVSRGDGRHHGECDLHVPLRGHGAERTPTGGAAAHARRACYR